MILTPPLLRIFLTHGAHIFVTLDPFSLYYENKKAICIFQICNIVLLIIKAIRPSSLILQEADTSPRVGTGYVIQSPVSACSCP